MKLPLESTRFLLPRTVVMHGQQTWNQCGCPQKCHLVTGDCVGVEGFPVQITDIFHQQSDSFHAEKWCDPWKDLDSFPSDCLTHVNGCQTAERKQPKTGESVSICWMSQNIWNLKKTWSIIIAYHRFKYHQSGTFGYPISRQPRGSRDSNGKGDNQLRHWRSIAHWLNEPIQSTPMD